MWDTVITRDSKVGRLLYHNTKPIRCSYKANLFTKKLIKSFLRSRYLFSPYRDYLNCTNSLHVFNNKVLQHIRLHLFERFI